MLRSATRADGDLLLEWRNDPSTVAMSRVARRVESRDHEAWLGSVFQDDGRVLLIATQEDRPVGMVRFGKTDTGEFEVSITVGPDSRGRGFGSEMLYAAAKHAFGCLAAQALVAEVREENHASRRIFERAGYELASVGAGWRRYRLEASILP